VTWLPKLHKNVLLGRIDQDSGYANQPSLTIERVEKFQSSLRRVHVSDRSNKNHSLRPLISSNITEAQPLLLLPRAGIADA
jgi:hypothetical protein